jgi:hypothetical protein
MASNRERCGDAAKSESFKPAKPGPQLQDGAVRNLAARELPTTLVFPSASARYRCASPTFPS